MKPERILVIAAHPDDEVLGCGGTMAKVSAHDPVHVCFVGQGVRSRKTCCARML